MLNKKQKNTFLSFGIHRETFAVSVKKVPEVLQKQYITKIPNTPEFIKGVINFRGNIIPAIEMRTKFGFPAREKDEKYVIIVFDLSLDDKKMLVGAITDKVNDVIAFNDAEIQPVPELGLKYNAEFIQGMIKTGENFTMILDIDKIFSKEEVNIIDTSKVNQKKASKTTAKKTNVSKSDPKNTQTTETLKKQTIAKPPPAKEAVSDTKKTPVNKEETKKNQNEIIIGDQKKSNTKQTGTEKNETKKTETKKPEVKKPDNKKKK